MENERQIFRILNQYYRSASDEIIVRPNKHPTPQIDSTARVFIRKSPFISWHRAIPKVALMDENVFVAFHTTILLGGPQSDQRQQFWDGGGNFLVNVSPGSEHNSCGYADLSFTVRLSEKLFSELKPLLEDVEARLAAEGEKEQKIKDILAKMWAAATGNGPPYSPSLKEISDLDI